MNPRRKFWLVLIGAILGMVIIACSCGSLVPTPTPTSFPPTTQLPATLPPATLPPATLPPATSVNQSGTGQEPMPGLAGKWIDPDSAGGGTISTIEFQNGLYVVTSVINTGRGPNELTTSSWANGVLTWEYCPANMYCITQHTVSLDGDVLTVDWASDSGSSGTSELQREP